MNITRLNTLNDDKVIVRGNGGNSGGGGSTVSANDVTFYDYDDTVLYSYTKEDFLKLKELPALPTREGLICQGWNWDYENAIEYVRDYGFIEIGANYTTDNGRTRIYIKTFGEAKRINLSFNNTGRKPFNVYWGDGTIKNYTTNGELHIYHDYQDGDYCIEIEPLETKLELGVSGFCSLFNEESSTNSFKNRAIVKKVCIGESVAVVNRTFLQCDDVEYISFSNISVSLGIYTFSNTINLKNIILPKTAKNNNTSYLSIRSYINHLILNQGITAVNACCDNYKLAIPNTVTNIHYLFSSRMREIIIPSSVVSINSINCYRLGKYDFSHHTSVPTLSGSILQKTNMKIIVPDNLYDEWIAATNWSNYASYIVKVSEYNG